MRRLRAFTLIELMVVLAIAAVLAALAYPSYKSLVIKSRRVEAQAALLDIMQNQERYYSLHNVYLAFSADSSDPDEQRFRWWSGNSPKNSAYELSAHACPGASLKTCVEVQAEPGTRRVDGRFRDPDCATLTLVSTGEHRAAGLQPRCWP